MGHGKEVTAGERVTLTFSVLEISHIGDIPPLEPITTISEHCERGNPKALIPGYVWFRSAKETMDWKPKLEEESEEIVTDVDMIFFLMFLLYFTELLIHFCKWMQTCFQSVCRS